MGRGRWAYSSSQWARRRTPWWRSFRAARLTMVLALLGVTSVAYVATDNKPYSSFRWDVNEQDRRARWAVTSRGTLASAASISIICRAKILSGYARESDARGALVLLAMGSMVGGLAEGQGVKAAQIMALHWFNPPVYIRTDRPGLRYGISHVEGASEQLLKWTKHGPNGATRCASVWPHWPTRCQLKRLARLSRLLPRRRRCSSLLIRSLNRATFTPCPERRRQQRGSSARRIRPASDWHLATTQSHRHVSPPRPLAVLIARSSVCCSAGPKTG